MNAQQKKRSTSRVMTPRKRFLLGGGGALMPVLVSILALDISALIAEKVYLSAGNLIGLGIRYCVLFVIGGVVAWLHEDENKSFKLFELGIAAPALLTSIITAQGVMVDRPANESYGQYLPQVISSAYANEPDTSTAATTQVDTGAEGVENEQGSDETDKELKPKLDEEQSFLAEVLDGVLGGIYRKMNTKSEANSSDQTLDN